MRRTFWATLLIAADQLGRVHRGVLDDTHLQDDQAIIGVALTGLAMAAALRWLGGVSWPYRRVGQAPSRSSSRGTAAHET